MIPIVSCVKSFFFQAEDGIRDLTVTGVQTCALPILCWGSYHGPHKHDLPLREFVDLVLAVRAQGYSIEASNPRHDHEWRGWGEGKLPPRQILLPRGVRHPPDLVEHPPPVAARPLKYARPPGRRSGVAGP